MNRIAGIFNLDGAPVDGAALRPMAVQLGAQSESQCQTWIEGPISMTCVQMGGVSENFSNREALNGRLPIAFDGRIDNRDELLATLKPDPKPKTDADLVRAAYRKWGSETPQHLLGDFSLALWDTHSQRLLCARDHFGVKPFYYAVNDQVFVFASTPQAILASGLIPMVINPGRVADFVVDSYEDYDKTSTFFESIQRLEPAHVLLVIPEGIKVLPYWELTPKDQHDSLNDQSYIDKFNELFSKAVHCRLNNGLTAAAMLSGGLDSSSIAAVGTHLLKHAMNQPLRTIAVVSEKPGTNRETAYIQSMLSGNGFKSVVVAESEFIKHIDSLFVQFEKENEPFDYWMTLNRAVYLVAHSNGVSCVLDGIDGDATLSATGSIPNLWRRGKFKTALGETLGVGGLIGGYYQYPKLKSVIGSLRSAFMPEMLRSARRWVDRHIFKKGSEAEVIKAAIKSSLINHEFAQQVHLSERRAQVQAHRNRSNKLTPTQAHQHILNHPMYPVALERYERVAAAFGVEAAHPFFDVRLVEFCVSLPWYLKSHRGWTKMILRKACQDLLPEDVIWRKDKDSLMWYYNRLLLDVKLGDLLDAIRNEKSTLETYINYNKLWQICQNYCQAPSDEDARHIMHGAALAIWLQQQRELAKTITTRKR